MNDTEKKIGAMEDNYKADTAYLLYESETARLERINKRLWISNFIKDFILCLIIGGFLMYLNQYDVVDYEYTQDGKGINIIGDKNGVDYNVTTAENKNQEEKIGES